MSVRFVDTNVLLYAISTDPSEADKSARANALLEQRDLCLSTQVLQEFYVQATRASRTDRLAPDVAGTLVESFTRFPVKELSLDIVRAAIATSERFAISYWDAAILETARSVDCDIVLSEDLSDTTDFDGVRVHNPFTPG